MTNNSERTTGRRASLVSNVLPERVAHADRDPALRAPRGFVSATQGFPRVRENCGRAGLYSHAAIFPNPDGRGTCPLEESAVLHAAHGLRRHDIYLQSVSGTKSTRSSMLANAPSYTRASFKVSVSWLAINALLWLWLILQRILYCSVWHYWSYVSGVVVIVFL